jgi:hypothetical protein
VSATERIKARPAETTAGTGGIVTIAAAALGADATTITVLGAASAFAPAAVSWLVDHGGLRGVYRRVVYGDRGATSPSFVINGHQVAALSAHTPKKTTARKTRPKAGDSIRHGKSITDIVDPGRPEAER